MLLVGAVFNNNIKFKRFPKVKNRSIVLLFLSTGAIQYFFLSLYRKALNAIHFHLCSLIANMVTIVTNFQQQLAVVKVFSNSLKNF